MTGNFCHILAQRFIILLIFIYFFKQLLVSSIVPIWQTPDEQAHFAQVAYFSEFGKMPKINPDLNLEIYKSEELLGTLRDEMGNNKFTYHPEYKIEYTNSLTGKYEQEIKSIPVEDRKVMVKYEAANYPPLYYWIAAVPYKIFYNADLITRIYSVRFISILMGLGIIFVSWLIAKEIFPKSKLLKISLPLLVAFHPMLSFVSAGVSSDNLMNLLFTILIYLTLLLINKGLGKKIILLIMINIFLLYLTKPQFIFAIPIFLLALIFSYFINNNPGKRLKILALLGSMGLVLLTFFMATNSKIIEILQGLYSQGFFSNLPSSFADPISFSKMLIYRTLHETIPWYWGVFKWLGVTLPVELLRLINRLLILISFGVFIKIIIAVRKPTKENLIFIYLILVSLFYFAGIIIFDYIFYSVNNYSFGLQGRYFFPTVVAHMVILLVGLNTLFSVFFKRLREIIIKLFVIIMLILNIYIIWLNVNIYYNTETFTVFVKQASQYKPDIFKGESIIFLLFITAISIVLFLIWFLTRKEID